MTRLKCLFHFFDVISEYIHGIHVTYHEMVAPLELHTFIEMFRAIDIIMRIPLKLSEDVGPHNFFLIFSGHKSFLWGPLIPLFWIFGDISHGFQSQSGQPYLHLAEAYMCNIFTKIHL